MNPQLKNEKHSLVLLIVLLIVAAIINVQSAYWLKTYKADKKRLIKDLQKSLRKHLKVKKVRVKNLMKIIGANEPGKCEYFILARLKINDKKTKTYIIKGEYEKKQKLTIQRTQRFHRKASSIAHNNFRMKKS